MDYKISDEVCLSLNPNININKIIYKRKGGYLGGAEVEGIYEEAIFTNEQYEKLIDLIPITIKSLNDKYKIITLIEELHGNNILKVTLSGYEDSKQVCFIYKHINSFHHWLFKKDLLDISVIK